MRQYQRGESYYTMNAEIVKREEPKEETVPMEWQDLTHEMDLLLGSDQETEPIPSELIWEEPQVQDEPIYPPKYVVVRNTMECSRINSDTFVSTPYEKYMDLAGLNTRLELFERTFAEQLISGSAMGGYFHLPIEAWPQVVNFINGE